MAKKRRDPRREVFWREQLARHGSSGLSVRAFCRRERLNESSFYFWRRTIRDRDRAGKSPPPAMACRGVEADGVQPVPSFLPVIVRDDGEAGASMSIELAGGRLLRFPDSISAERLANIILALETRGAG